MRLAALMLVLSAAPGLALAADGGSAPQGPAARGEAPGAIAGGTVKLWAPDTQTLTVSLGRKQEVVLRTGGAVVHGALAIGRVVDVTYVGDRASVVTVRP